MDTGPEDELSAESKGLGGDCVKVMHLLKADSSLLKDRALDVLHLGVSRGCIEIVEQVVEFYTGAGRPVRDFDALSRERYLYPGPNRRLNALEVAAVNGNLDVLALLLTKIKSTVRQLREVIQRVVDSIERYPASLGVYESLSDARRNNPEFKFLVAAVIPKGNLDVLALLIAKIPSATLPELHRNQLREVIQGVVDSVNGYPVSPRIYESLSDVWENNPEVKFLVAAVIQKGNFDILALLITKFSSAALLELRRNQLRQVTQVVVGKIKNDFLRVYESLSDAWSKDPEFNFLFWDFELGQERVSEHLFHFLFTNRFQTTLAEEADDIRRSLWGKVWEYQGAPLWQSLLMLHDAQGRTPLHVAVDEETVWHFVNMFANVPAVDQVTAWAFALETRDGLGRTPWHRAVAKSGNQGTAAEALDRMYHLDGISEALDRKSRENGILDVSAPEACLQRGNKFVYETRWEQRMKDPATLLRLREIDVDSLESDLGVIKGIGLGRQFSETTPLHSALMHGSLAILEKNFSPKDRLFQCSVDGFGPCALDALELATLTGNTAAVKLLLKTAAQRHSRRQSSKSGRNSRYGWVLGDWTKDERGKRLKYPTIYIAAHSGNYEMLKAFIDSKICDPYIQDEKGYTVLHAVLDPKTFRIEGHLLDFANVKYIPRNHKGTSTYEGRTEERQGCINLLLQSGCDIFMLDENGQAPYPQGSLSKDKEFLSWWYERQLKEFNANQNAMSFATSAISVMATLVATASYVGPLQPPLGYSSGDVPNQIQAEYILVQMFIVCDTLSFYLAIAAITFSLIPGIPMPQQSMVAELQKTRGTVIWAIAALFPSIVCILLAFAAGSVVVISGHGVAGRGSMTIITGSIGGMFCLIGFFFLFIRLLGIIFPRTRWVRNVYDFTSLVLCLGTEQRSKKMLKRNTEMD